jgi:hypothetical protein
VGFQCAQITVSEALQIVPVKPRSDAEQRRFLDPSICKFDSLRLKRLTQVRENALFAATNFA